MIRIFPSLLSRTQLLVPLPKLTASCKLLSLIYKICTGLRECGLRANLPKHLRPNTMRPNNEGTPTTDAYRNYRPTGRRWIHTGDYLLPPCPDCSLGIFLSYLCISSLLLFPPERRPDVGAGGGRWRGLRAEGPSPGAGSHLPCCLPERKAAPRAQGLAPTFPHQPWAPAPSSSHAEGPLDKTLATVTLTGGRGSPAPSHNPQPCKWDSRQCFVKFTY